MFSFRHFRHHLHARMHEHHGGHHGAGHRMRGQKMFDAGALRYIVLQLIADQPRHGYEIIKEIEQRVGGGYSPSPGVHSIRLLAMLEDRRSRCRHARRQQEAAPGSRRRAVRFSMKIVALSTRFRRACPISGFQPSRGRWLRQSRHAHACCHELKAVVVERVREQTPSEDQLKKILNVLERATLEIKNL